MRTQHLAGDIWISPKQNNGDFDYWLVVNIINMDEACGCNNPKYVAEVCAISPKEAGPENIKKALECCGMEETSNPLKLVQALHSYGVYAPCTSFSGNNARKVLQQAKCFLDVIASLLGVFLDGPKNAIGHTGWDLIRGDTSIETAMAN